MLHSRHLNNTINRIQERALGIAYKDFESSFKTLMEKDESVSIHAKEPVNTLIETFRIKADINPLLWGETFCERTIYNLKNNDEFSYPG